MQVTFDCLTQKITIEGEEMQLVELLKLVREIAPKLPNINIISSSKVSPTSSTAIVPTGPAELNGNTLGAIGLNGFATNGHSHQTMRSFVRGLSLVNMYERIAAITYYQKIHASNPTVSPKDLGDFFTHCGFQKPTQMPVALSDAKRKYGYMESPGHGAWRITTQGENLILGKLEEIQQD